MGDNKDSKKIKKYRPNKNSKQKLVNDWHKAYANIQGAPADDRIIGRRITSTSTNADAFSRSKNKSINDKIRLCRSAYSNVGIIGNVIDIMTDFALEGLTIVHESEAAERLFNKWAEKVKIYDVLEEMLRAIFRDGNVPVIHYDAKIGSESVSKMKRAVAAKTVAKDLFSTTKVTPAVIPYKFRILDVLKLKKSNSDIFGRSQYYYQLDANVVKETLKKTDAETIELIQQIRNSMTSVEWAKFKSTGDFPLKNIDMIFYKKDSCAEWAIPMLWRIIDDLKFKTTLRNMDISIAESITNAVQIFKIGKIEEGLPPSPAMFVKLADMLRNPSKSKQIVWDNLIEIESDYPDTGKILGDAKYKEVNADILAGLGISEVLIGGPGGNYSNSFLSCRTLLERLETARNKVLAWLNQYLLQITKAFKLRKTPIAKFAHMSLRDEDAEKSMLLELVDRNVISYRTLLERFGENLDIETKRMSREDTLRQRLEKNGFPNALKKLGKFGPQDNASMPNLLNDEENDDKENNNKNNEENGNTALPSAQGPKGEKGGRPQDKTNQPKQQKVKRDTKPKGMAKIDELKIKAHEAFKYIKDTIAKHVSKSRAIDIKKLTASDLSEISDISMQVMARFTELDNIDTFNIIEAAFFKVMAPAKLDRCVKSVYNSLVKKFTEKNNKKPNEKQRDKLRSSAWAICRANLKM